MDQWMTREMRGWERMWAAIAKLYGDAECRNPETGDDWQYMGTCDGLHQFRHRCLPKTGLRAFDTVVVEPDDDVLVMEEARP